MEMSVILKKAGKNMAGGLSPQIFKKSERFRKPKLLGKGNPLRIAGLPRKKQ